MTTIYLDDAPLPGYDHRIVVQEQIERKDASGETSAGTQIHKGWKPAILTVSVKFKFEDTVGVAVLKALWRQRTETGTPFLWRITHDVMDAMDIREVRFTDFFTISAPEQKKGWDAVFNMIEVRSVSERSQATDVAATEEPGAPEGLFTVTGAAAEETTATAETWLGKLLVQANDFVGKRIFGDPG